MACSAMNNALPHRKNPAMFNSNTEQAFLGSVWLGITNRYLKSAPTVMGFHCSSSSDISTSFFEARS